MTTNRLTNTYADLSDLDLIARINRVASTHRGRETKQYARLMAAYTERMWQAARTPEAARTAEVPVAEVNERRVNGVPVSQATPFDFSASRFD